ncbi:MAG TPA: RluA family pseudouridine synthase [Spirochaetales bacterium]|nr:RluA family pseudouridine synthase [Spirochaetales bacterium]HRZ64031.1 RluA family pseudouridine synthase [Spirochaetia bacterium]
MKKPKPPRPASPPQAPAGPARSWESVVPELDPGGRVDGYVARAAAGILSRSQLKAREASILVNGRPAKPSRPVAPGDRVRVDWVEEASPGIVPEDIPLDLIYEDGSCLVLDKAQGMVVHPGAGNRRGTAANALAGLLARAGTGCAAAGEGFRAGIVHRLDKDTSGVMIAAKDPRSQAFLAAQFKDRLTRKDYVAVTRGVPRPSEGRISDRLGRDRRERKRFARVESGGKAAVTDYRVLASWGDADQARAEGKARAAARSQGYALVALRPRTGRTHQLRVHMAGLGCPILGDPIYGKRDPRFPEASLMLHARRLRITLPGEAEPRTFSAPLPERFKALLRRLAAELGEPTMRGEKTEGAE